MFGEPGVLNEQDGQYDVTTVLLGGRPQDVEEIHALVLEVGLQHLLGTSMDIVGLSEH